MEYPSTTSPKETKRDAFEQMMRPLIVFKDIDPASETAAYHQDMVDGLLQRIGRKPSLMRTILTAQRAAGRSLEKIIVESIVAEDISRGIGTQRNVDLFSFVFKGAESFAMTVSLDIEASAKVTHSPSFHEAEILRKNALPKDKKPAVQRYFGFTQIRDKRGLRGLICKEYLPGVMLANFTQDVKSATEQFGKEALTAIARATGRTFGQSFYEIGGVPSDAHHMNVIINEDEGGVTARFCDVEHARADFEGVTTEKLRMLQTFGPYGGAFLDGIREANRLDSPLPEYFY